MRLTVLAVPGCPNVKLLEQRLMRALEGSDDVTISRHEIADQEQAARRGMNGSPTLLVDGIDPFAGPGQLASASCRLFRGSSGKIDRAPSVRQLREAIRHPVNVVADAAGEGWLDALQRGGRGRVAPDERGLRAVHQAVLRSFAATGKAPSRVALDNAASPFDSSQILEELAEGDYLGLDRRRADHSCLPVLRYSHAAHNSDHRRSQRLFDVRYRRPRRQQRCWARACRSSRLIRRPVRRYLCPSTEPERCGIRTRR